MSFETRRLQWWANFTKGTLVFLLLVGVTTLCLSIFAYRRARFSRCQTIYTAQYSGTYLDESCNSHVIDSPTPIDLKLPNDLSLYVGRTFSVYARTNIAHTLRIDNGPQNTRFAGAYTVATWSAGPSGPNIVHFHVQSAEEIYVIKDEGINFS
jgi:hypothetical protein